MRTADRPLRPCGSSRSSVGWRSSRCRQSSCMPVVATILPECQQRLETELAGLQKEFGQLVGLASDAAIALVLRIAVSEPASVRSLRDFGRVSIQYPL